jgi:hypothetical protein
MPKLTLSADPATVKLAKTLAADQDTSVSAMFERFVKLMAATKLPRSPVAPLTRRASGMVTMPKGKQARDVLIDALLDRHGLDR